MSEKKIFEKTYQEAEIRLKYEQLTGWLIAHQLTITTMESATSGQIASLITDTEGASAVLKGAYITYSNEAKIAAGVPAEVINRYTVYSEETAKAMAEVSRKAFDADFGIGVTGTMGNVDPANADASTPGKVYFAIAQRTQTTGYAIELPPQRTRLLYKLAVAEEVLDRLWEIVKPNRYQ